MHSISIARSIDTIIIDYCRLGKVFHSTLQINYHFILHKEEERG
jgi:hypothetical protein